MRSVSKRELDAMIEEAIVDAYGDYEQTSGFTAMIRDNLALPFDARVLGVEVKVIGVEQRSDTTIMVMCRRGTEKQRIDLLDLPLPSPAPKGAEWIEAWRHWNG
jgi:hypothetical protein